MPVRRASPRHSGQAISPVVATARSAQCCTHDAQKLIVSQMEQVENAPGSLSARSAIVPAHLCPQIKLMTLLVLPSGSKLQHKPD